MKKVATILFCLLISISDYAQNFSGISAGTNYAIIKGDDVAGGVTISYKPSIKVGYSTEFVDLKKNLCLQLGMAFTGKGYKARNANYTNVVALTYAEVQLNLIDKISISEKNKFIFGAGPYLGIGIDYKTILTRLSGPSANTVSKQNGDFADFGVRLTDLGFTGIGGVQINNKWQIAVNYQYGLSTIFYSTDFGNVKNRVASLTLAYSW